MSCVLTDWPRNRDGYGTKCIAGFNTLHHRKVVADSLRIPVRTMGGVVMHSCDNPACVNIAHLTLGTQQQNVADQVAKGRTVRGSRNGQCRLTLEQVQFIRASYVPRHPEYGGAALARLLGVCQSQVSRIILKKKWGGF